MLFRLYGFKDSVIVLVSALFLNRCLNKKSSSGPSDKKDQEKEKTDQETVSERETLVPERPDLIPSASGSVVIPSDPDSLVCEASGNSVNLDKIPDGGNEYRIRIKIYGNEISSMLVFSLPDYQKKDLTDIFLATDSGQLIAQRGVFDINDIKEDGFYRLFVFDHLRLRQGDKIVVLFKMISGLFLKKNVNLPVLFETRFRGLPVQGPGFPGFHNPDYYDRHPDNVFSPEDIDFLPEKGESVARFAGFGTKFLKRDDLEGTVVTDLLGDSLSEHGETFHQIGDTNLFIVYRLMDQKYWFRTFIRVS